MTSRCHSLAVAGSFWLRAADMRMYRALVTASTMAISR